MKPSYETFKKTVWNFYKKQGRRFPWRETTDPYKILVSEIMLQQTQTTRVVSKYNEFLEAFPTIEKLASVKLSDVLHIWIGLGYNRRAKFLWECAKQICETKTKTFPQDARELMKLKGIGQSTAGALLNFAFQIPTPFIETNIKTVFIHHLLKNKKNIDDKTLMKLVSETLPKKNSREWFYALYDYGSHLKQTLKVDPAQKSKSYKKQSSFKGSFRERRAFILKHLIKEKTKTKNLQKLFTQKFKTQDFKEVLHSLKKDSLI